MGFTKGTVFHICVWFSNSLKAMMSLLKRLRYMRSVQVLCERRVEWSLFRVERVTPKSNFHHFNSTLVLYVTLSVKSRLKSQNLMMRFETLKLDFNLWHHLTQSILKIPLDYVEWVHLEINRLNHKHKNDFSWVFTDWLT